MSYDIWKLTRAVVLAAVVTFAGLVGKGIAVEDRETDPACPFHTNSQANILIVGMPGQ